MAAPVRRRTDLALKDKYIIACYIDDHPEETQKDIAARFSIPKSTMSQLASNVSQIKRAYHENTMASNSKRMRKPSFDDLDSSLLTWFSQMRSAQPTFSIDGKMLHTKANQLASIIGYDKEISTSWIDRWKARHGIYFKQFMEVSSVDPAKVNASSIITHNDLTLHGAVAREDNDIEELTSAIVSENDGFVAIDILKRYLNIKNIADFRTLTLGQIEDLIEQNVAHTC